MNFINPYIEIYYRPESLKERFDISFYKEILWLFLKNLDNRLKMYKHRVNIVFVDSESLTGSFRFGSIYENRVFINITDFEKQNEYNKRKTLLEIVYNTFIELANVNGWDKDIIKDAYKKSMKDNYQFSYQTDFKTNRNKEARGNIKLSLTENAVTLTAKVEKTNSDEKIESDLLIIGEHIISWHRLIREFGWYDNSRFGLKFLSGQLWILVNLENMQTETIINPKKRLRSDIELFLNELYC